MGDIAHQLGLGAQVDWATPITPDRFLEFTTESLQRRQNVAVSNGIRSGRRYGGQGRRITRHDAGGSVTTEVATTGFGVLFEHLLGAVATTNPGTLAFQHVFTPGSLLDKGLTLQKGVDEGDGDVQAFTYPGSKVISADFSVEQDGLLMATWEFDAREEETATALAAASYTDPIVFTYSEGTLSIDGTPKANVRSVGSLRIVNNLLTERFFLGNQGIKEEQKNVPFDELGGTLDVEFQGIADFYSLFAADTSAELDLVFVGPQIEASHDATLSINIADVRFEGETPQVTGPELVYSNIPFVGLDPESGDAVTITYKTTDATP
jgi:hypothetical protein